MTLSIGFAEEAEKMLKEGFSKENMVLSVVR